MKHQKTVKLSLKKQSISKLNNNETYIVKGGATTAALSDCCATLACPPSGKHYCTNFTPATVLSYCDCTVTTC